VNDKFNACVEGDAERGARTLVLGDDDLKKCQVFMVNAVSALTTRPRRRRKQDVVWWSEFGYPTIYVGLLANNQSVFSTVAVLAQGTSWADAVTHAFDLLCGPLSRR
jgi:hypothetical protein